MNEYNVEDFVVSTGDTRDCYDEEAVDRGKNEDYDEDDEGLAKNLLTGGRDWQ